MPDLLGVEAVGSGAICGSKKEGKAGKLSGCGVALFGPASSVLPSGVRCGRLRPVQSLAGVGFLDGREARGKRPFRVQSSEFTVHGSKPLNLEPLNPLTIQ